MGTEVREGEDEAALRSLVEVMTLLHSAGDPDSVLRAVVQGVCDVLGYRMAAIRVLDEATSVLHTAAVVGPADAVATMTGGRLSLAELATEFQWADRDGDVFFIPYDRLPEGVISTWIPDVPVVTAPGAWHPMDTLYVALNDRSGHLLGVLGVDLPPNGRRPDAAQRDLLQAFARQASLALDRAKLIEQQSRLVATLLERQRESLALVNTLTHDLKAPLTVIRGHAEIARDSVDTGSRERLGHHLNGIEKAVLRMTTTIDELLEYREPRGPRPLSASTVSSVDLADVARETVTFSAVVAERRGLDLHLELVGDDWNVVGDRQQLLRALDNLVSNALKYTPADGTVVVTVDGAGSEVAVSCTDDGVGIPPEEHETIFIEYVRAAHARDAGIEGTGLGLPSARRIVAAHGGTLTLESAPGTGSTFTARLPRSSAVAHHASHPLP